MRGPVQPQEEAGGGNSRGSEAPFGTEPGPGGSQPSLSICLGQASSSVLLRTVATGVSPLPPPSSPPFSPCGRGAPPNAGRLPGRPLSWTRMRRLLPVPGSGPSQLGPAHPACHSSLPQSARPSAPGLIRAFPNPLRALLSLTRTFSTQPPRHQPRTCPSPSSALGRSWPEPRVMVAPMASWATQAALPLWPQLFGGWGSRGLHRLGTHPLPDPVSQRAQRPGRASTPPAAG